MELRKLGKTDIKVTPIGLGVMQLSGNSMLMNMMLSQVPEGEVNPIIKAAIDGGINWFDTAEMYGFGYSERCLVEGLSDAGIDDADIIIGTKWMPFLRTSRSIPRTIENRLRNLEGYTIDLYMVHMPVSFSSIESQMNAMADLVDAGKIRSVGVSNFSASQMRQASVALSKRGLPLAVNQVEYSLMHRDIEKNGVLETAKELDITIVAWGPVAGGLLTGKYHDDPKILDTKPLMRKRAFKQGLERSRPIMAAMKEISARHGVTPTQVALNWLINFQGETVVAIPGASKIKHAEEAAGAMAFALSEEELAQLDQLST